MNVKKSFSEEPSNQNCASNCKIEILNCPHSLINCHSQVSDINQSYSKSNEHVQFKEYQLSIQTLKSAFKKTYDLKESSCSQCARLFRTTIIDSLEKVHDDLKGMSNSVFRGKRYAGSYVMVQSVLRELKESNQASKLAAKI
ncbi:MAG TPA: hypothetical protein VKA10_06110 [Prolixibacteraceae bacterium]|nr:hypothetical protein [Prolixibacteraceae bacterium]